MTVAEFEDAVRKLEGFTVVVRASAGQSVGDYDYQRRGIETWTVTEWVSKRVAAKLNGHEMSVVDGKGRQIPHWGTVLKNVRASYL